MDDDGYVWYEGRADDVIIAAGYRIGPFEVESACLEHPGGRRGGRRRLAGRAARQRRQGVRRAGGGPRTDRRTAKAIQQHVRTRLSAYHYPRRIEFVPSCRRRSRARSGGSSCARPRRGGSARPRRRPERRGRPQPHQCRQFSCDADGPRRRTRDVHVMTSSSRSPPAPPGLAEAAEEHLDDVFGYLALPDPRPGDRRGPRELRRSRRLFASGASSTHGGAAREPGCSGSRGRPRSTGSAPRHGGAGARRPPRCPSASRRASSRGSRSSSRRRSRP